MRRLAAAALLAVLIAATYSRTLGHGFVFDDRGLVIDNGLVRLPLARAGEVFSGARRSWSYRPVRVLSYQLDHALAAGLRPAVFHASNLAYHLAATLALASLARVTIPSPAGALAAGALFAVHPLASEAVAYVSGRRDLLVGLFGLLSLRFWWWFISSMASDDATRGRGRGVARLGRRTAALAASAVSAALALGAKETALVLPILAGLLLAVRWRRARVSIGPAAAAIAALAMGLGALLVALYPERIGPLRVRLGEPSLAAQPALSLRVLGQYCLLAVWPQRLSADYQSGAFALPSAPLDLPSLVAALAIGAILVGGLALLARGSLAGAGLLWFVVALLPVAQIVPYREVLAEHNAYLALAGLALAAGAAVASAGAHWPRATSAIMCAAVVALGARTWVRVGDWRDETTLWSATVEVAPNSLRANHNLGVALTADGRLLEARGALERAHALAPADRDVMLALASVSTRLGDRERAEALARRALAQQRDAPALAVLAWVQLASGDAAGAERTFVEALDLGGPDEDLVRGLRLARRRAERP